MQKYVPVYKYADVVIDAHKHTHKHALSHFDTETHTNEGHTQTHTRTHTQHTGPGELVYNDGFEGESEA